MVTTPMPPPPQGVSERDTKQKLYGCLVRSFLATGDPKLLEDALEVHTDMLVDALAKVVNAQADAYNAAHPHGPRMPKL